MITRSPGPMNTSLIFLSVNISRPYSFNAVIPDEVFVIHILSCLANVLRLPAVYCPVLIMFHPTYIKPDQIVYMHFVKYDRTTQKHNEEQKHLIELSFMFKTSIISLIFKCHSLGLSLVLRLALYSMYFFEYFLSSLSTP